MPDIDGISLLKEWSKDGLPCPVVIMTGHGSVETAVEATRLGAQDFVQKPISLAKLLAIVSGALETYQPPTARKKAAPAAIVEPIGNSTAMRDLREKAKQSALHHRSPVLITGEGGSGREMLARYIHQQSGRSGAFVAVDHCAVATNARNYFLGSNDEGPKGNGIFELAAEGSLFIPDVQDLPAETMKMIVQALESNNPADSDRIPPRLIGAGNADLATHAESSPKKHYRRRAYNRVTRVN